MNFKNDQLLRGLLLASATTLAACGGTTDSAPAADNGPVVKADEGMLDCPTDGSSAIMFSSTAGTAVAGVGPDASEEHSVEVPAGCDISKLLFRIEWDSAAEDLDMELRYQDQVIGSSAQGTTSFEEIGVSEPAPGVYTLVVNSYANVETAYMGSAQAEGPLECQPGKGKAAEVESGLLANLLNATPSQLFDVVVAFHGSRGVTQDKVSTLLELGVTGKHFRYLPIAGVRGTAAQILSLAEMSDVRSIFPNAQLQYEDVRARHVTGNDLAEAAPELINADGLPYSGAGVTVLVNDSGIDANHQDLAFGSKVLANASGHLSSALDFGMTPFYPLEDLPNSDVIGSHGTHVAGIVAGDGTYASFTGADVRGSAPGATLAGYGSGAILLVLDSLGGFEYALKLQDERPELNLRVVTNSFGATGDQGTPFNPNDPTNIVTKELADRGMAVVFSAGNSGSGPDSITGNFKKAPWISIAAAGNKDGHLGDYSSRGTLANGSYETKVGCETFTVEDRPTVVTPGTAYISTRAISGDASGNDAIADDLLSEEQGGAELAPFYTAKTGTSMAAPHLAGLYAILLEVNPALQWQDLKRIIQATATNMPGFEPWEVGAGFANIEAAIAMAKGLRSDYGSTSHLLNQANSRIELGDSSSEQVQLGFTPVGEPEVHEFEVGPGTALVAASWVQPQESGCSCAIVLTAPSGNRYGSAIALPVLAPRVSAVGTGEAGTWTLSVSGVGGVSGQDVDPLNLTNGYAAPQLTPLDITLEQIASGKRFGLGDLGNHPDAGFVERAVVERLIDGKGNGVAPNAALTRIDMAQYLMAWGVRQTRSHTGGTRFFDVAAGAPQAAADAVTRSGQLILDGSAEASALMPAADGNFNGSGSVTRQEVAYALTQASGREAIAMGYLAAGEPLYANFIAEDGSISQVPVSDAGQVNPALLGHVQDAILQGHMAVRFSADGSSATIQPTANVSRAEYAVAAVKAYSVLPIVY